MDTELLVDRRIDDGTKLVAQLVRDGFNVAVALWAKTREEGLWFLYIGSDSFDMKRNLGTAYQKLYFSLRKISDSSISISDVKLVDSVNPIAQAALRLRAQFAGRIPFRSRAQMLGGLAVEEVYIYPELGPMTPTEIMQTVIGLMSRQGFLQPSQVKLHDGSVIVAVPCGVKTNNNMVQVEVMEPSGVNRSIPLDQIASIQ